MTEDWRKEILEIYNFHRIKVKLFGPALKGRPKNGVKTGWGLRETAKELKLPLGKVCEDVNLAEAILSREEVRSCPTREKALKMVRKRLR